MYSSWKYLLIQNESDLRDPVRLYKLINASGRIGYFAVAGFAIAGIISVLTSLFFIYLAFDPKYKDYRLAFLATFAVLVALSAIFYVTAKIFLKETNLNPFRLYAKHPENFEFVTGKLTSSQYIANENRRQGRYHVNGTATTKEGQPLFVLEVFSRCIWNFTTQKEEDSLTEDDDWYEEKGKRPKLPIPAYFMYDKNDPKIATLIGIDAKFIKK